jgi:hypothetical protein
MHNAPAGPKHLKVMVLALRLAVTGSADVSVFE